MTSERAWPGCAPVGSAYQWLVETAMPFWLERAWDNAHAGFVSRLDARGEPVRDEPKASLVQSRMLFVCAHLAKVAGPGPWVEGIDRALAALEMFRDPASGGYVKALARDGSRTGAGADLRIDAYDQSFVLLGLGALYKVRPSVPVAAMIETTWRGLNDVLGDAQTGGFHEDSDARDPSRPYPMPRRQNPHMHLFEAFLEIFDATGKGQWLTAAAGMVTLLDRHFTDPRTGALREFLDRDLGPLPGPRGEIREPGHQFEWVWLLRRYGTLAGLDMQERMAWLYGFGRRGIVASGALAGLAVDELSADGTVRTPTLLLWPQTEALKAHLARAEGGDAEAAERARALLGAMFRSHVQQDLPVWRNQVGPDGETLQPEAPTRLLYHLALAITEARRCGIDAARSA